MAGVNTLENYVSQLFVIQNSGLVVLSRRYNVECFDQATQLVGGFIGALLNFLQNETSSNVCGESKRGLHNLQMVEMTCSKWFIKTHKDYFIVMMIDKQSPLVNDQPDIVNHLLSNTTTALDIMETFQTSLPKHVFMDYSEEFGNILDNVLYETISTRMEDEITFQNGVLGKENGTSIYLGGYQTGAYNF